MLTAMKTLLVSTRAKTKTEGAKDVLRQNLESLMSRSSLLNSRNAISARTGLSPRTIGYMLQEEAGNPTLANLEAVAAAFHLEVWELLMPGLDVSKVTTHVSAKEQTMQRKIEENMRALGITEYRIKKK